jgi:hypothetical protein
VALEAGNSAHVDVIAVGIATVAILVLATARTRTRTALGGVLLGLAIATKMTPALVMPAVLRRRWVTVAVSAGSAFVVVYIPHVLRVGGKVIGFLPGYLQQENYTSGTRYGIVGLFVTGPLASVVAVLILAAIALAVLEFADPGRPWQGAMYMTAGALAVTTPHYQWYSLLLVMLVALDGRPEWLAFAAGGYYAAQADMGRFTPPWRLVNAIAYGVPLVVVAIGWLVRRELARRAMARTAASAAGLVPLAGVPLAGVPLAGVPVASAATEAVPAEAVPAEAVPAEAVPAESVLAGSAPARSLPRRPVPTATALAGTGPAGAAPGATMPGATMPGATMPGATMPGATVPAGFASAGTAADVGREVPV